VSESFFQAGFATEDKTVKLWQSEIISYLREERRNIISISQIVTIHVVTGF